MKITNITGEASGQGIGTGLSTGKLADPSGSDVSWFSAAMQEGGDQTPMTLENASRPFNELFQSLQGKTDVAARRLKKAAASVDPQDIRQANKSLSSFYLESMLSAKLVGKAAQSVEKLTNLQ